MSLPHNRLLEVSTGCPGPMELDVSHNRLTSLLDLGTRLQRLDISHNRIESLQTLASCRNLQWLDARCNRLRSAHPLATLPLLRALWLGGNHLTRLWEPAGELTAPFLPHLRLLHVQGNQELAMGSELTACWRLTSLQAGVQTRQDGQSDGNLVALRVQQGLNQCAYRYCSATGRAAVFGRAQWPANDHASIFGCQHDAPSTTGHGTGPCSAHQAWSVRPRNTCCMQGPAAP